MTNGCWLGASRCRDSIRWPKLDLAHLRRSSKTSTSSPFPCPNDFHIRGYPLTRSLRLQMQRPGGRNRRAVPSSDSCFCCIHRMRALFPERECTLIEDNEGIDRRSKTFDGVENASLQSQGLGGEVPKDETTKAFRTFTYFYTQSHRNLEVLLFLSCVFVLLVFLPCYTLATLQLLASYHARFVGGIRCHFDVYLPRIPPQPLYNSNVIRSTRPLYNFALSPGTAF